MQADEVWMITGVWSSAITHAPGPREWSYNAPSIGGWDNITLCGRKAHSRSYKTGDDGTIPMDVTCKQCAQRYEKAMRES